MNDLIWVMRFQIPLSTSSYKLPFRSETSITSTMSDWVKHNLSTEIGQVRKQGSHLSNHKCGSRGGGGTGGQDPPPPGKSQKGEFSSNTGPDPRK